VIIDGGVLNPLPTNVPINSGIKKVIAVNVLQSPDHVNQGYLLEQERLKALNRLTFNQNPLKYLQFKVSRGIALALSPNIPDIIVRSLQASEYIIAEQSAQHADVMIHPDLTGINWYELYKVDELIKCGEEAALKALPAIKELVKI
jgi:predicted acylesterase/phospholipase RssA